MAVHRNTVRVLVVDDDQLVRTGIRLLLRGNVNISVVGEASSHRGVHEMIADLHPDVLLMDVMMPDESGLSVARRVRLAHPNLRIVLMSSLGSRALHTDAHNVGVDTFIPKTAPAADFIGAIIGDTQVPKPALTVLSDRELEVTELVAAGASNEEISAALPLSPNTIKTYISRSMDKTGTSNRVQLANWFHALSNRERG